MVALLEDAFSSRLNLADASRLKCAEMPRPAIVSAGSVLACPTSTTTFGCWVLENKVEWAFCSSLLIFA